MVTDKYVFFWNGVFSQWYPSKFVIEGVEYNCCEQYMMAQKALLFNDMENHKMIMYSKSPNEQKGFGRRVKGFDKDKWEAVCRGSYSTRIWRSSRRILRCWKSLWILKTLR